MRIKETKIYQFNELSKERQEEIIDTNRNINVEFDWWEYSVDDMCEQIKEKVGIEVNSEDIKFEFMSRSNSIWIEVGNMEEILRGKYEDLEELDIPNKFGCYCRDLGGGMMSDLLDSEIRDDIITFYSDYDDENDDDEVGGLLKMKEKIPIKEKIVDDLKEIQQILNKGYRNIYDVYNELISDEAVKETIELNEMEFEE